jgi:hypothetical protein
MIALIVIVLVVGFALGWFVRGLIVRRLWKASLRFRDAAMAVSRSKGGDRDMP